MPASLSTNSSPACVAALCSGVKWSVANRPGTERTGRWRRRAGCVASGGAQRGGPLRRKFSGGGMSCSESSQTEADPLPPYRFQSGTGRGRLCGAKGRLEPRGWPSCHVVCHVLAIHRARSAASTLWTCHKGIEPAEGFTLHGPRAAEHGGGEGRQGVQGEGKGRLLAVAVGGRGLDALTPQ